jgi:hypothetical protein
MFGRKRSRDDFAEQITAHLEIERDELKREGLSDEDARRTGAPHRQVGVHFTDQAPSAARNANPNQHPHLAFLYELHQLSQALA